MLKYVPEVEKQNFFFPPPPPPKLEDTPLCFNTDFKEIFSKNSYCFTN